MSSCPGSQRPLLGGSGPVGHFTITIPVCTQRFIWGLEEARGGGFATSAGSATLRPLSSLANAWLNLRGKPLPVPWPRTAPRTPRCPWTSGTARPPNPPPTGSWQRWPGLWEGREG